MMNRLVKKKSKDPESSGLQIQDPRLSEGDETYAIIWSGESSICTRNLNHYKAFTKKGTTVSVYSFVFILAGEGGHHIGYLEDMYENQRKKKMVKVRWFHKSEELTDLISNPQPHELIITSHFQNLSAECIDGLATILTPKHYTQCLNLVTQDFSDGIYMCSKQLKNDQVSSFPFCKLRGYNTQIIFSIISIPIDVNKNYQETSITKGKEKEEEEEEEEEKEEEEEEDDDDEEEEEEEEEDEEEDDEDDDEEEGDEDLKDVVVISDNDEVEKTHTFYVGQDVEVLCHDSGLRGCWFRCKILKMLEKEIKVLHMDVKDAVDHGKLKEWVPMYKIAPLDKLGMRWLGRNSVRPSRPINKESSNDGFNIGTAVDAQWCDGWWEGVVVGIGLNTHGNNDFHVYFPGENRLEYIRKADLRVSKEWFEKGWLDIKPKPDIISFVISNMKVESKSTLGEPSSETEENDVVKKKKKTLMVC